MEQKDVAVICQIAEEGVFDSIRSVVDAAITEMNRTRRRIHPLPQVWSLWGDEELAFSLQEWFIPLGIRAVVSDGHIQLVINCRPAPYEHDRIASEVRRFGDKMDSM